MSDSNERAEDDRHHFPGPGTLDRSMRRRSLYFFQKRSKLVTALQLFDAPQLLVSMGRHDEAARSLELRTDTVGAPPGGSA